MEKNMATSTSPDTTRSTPSKRLLLKEIAIAAGVSKSTVSKALNDQAGVSEDIRENIKRFARMMDYRPDPFVRAFHRRSSRMIGLYTGALTDFSFIQAVSGINTILCSRGYSAALIMDRPDPEKIPDLIHSRFVDGLIVFEDIPAGILNEVHHLKMPCVQVMSDPYLVPGVKVVTDDPVLSVQAAVDHLVGLGHQRIAGVFIGEDIREEHRQKITHPAYPWTRGYVEAMAKVKLKAMAIENPVAAAEIWLEEVFRQCPEVTAVIVQDITAGRYLRKELEQRRLRIPEDISMICTSCSGISLDKKSLYTAVNVAYEEVGRIAAESLLNRLEGKSDAGWEEMSLTAPAGIIDFGTTAPVERK
jgi:DNA-binding LacI/PurR family transcriptional regulator